MYSGDNTLETVKELMRYHGVYSGEPIDVDRLANVIAEAIYKVTKSSDYIEFLKKELEKKQG